MKDEYKRHPELAESTLLDEDAKNYIARMENGALSSVELQRSLLNLAHMLSAHHGSKVVILIDEYDTPIQQGYSRGFYKEVISFMEVVYPRMTDGNDTIFSFLLLAGYLTPAGSSVETEIGTFASLRLPNAEIRRIYNTEILSWIRTRQTGNIISEIEKAVYLSDAKRLQDALRKYMITSISFFDGAAEGFYHGMILGLVASLSSKYYIRSNREAGEGRFDLQLEPKAKELPGILMEFKAVSSSEKDKLPELAEDALGQTKDRNYARDLEERGISDIVRYGIAFSGKNVEVRVER